MTGGMAKYWIIPRVGGQGTASCRPLTGLLQSPHFLCSYVLHYIWLNYGTYSYCNYSDDFCDFCFIPINKELKDI